MSDRAGALVMLVALFAVVMIVVGLLAHSPNY